MGDAFSFQVRTLLENPTRYHVVQKQKNQVRQYLHESFRGTESDCTNGALERSVASGISGNTSLDTGPTSQVQPMVVQSAPPGPVVHQPKPQHPHLESYPRAPSLLGRVTGVASASPDPISGAMSPGLSSVATSNSEVSYLLLFIMVFRGMCDIPVGHERTRNLSDRCLRKSCTNLHSQTHLPRSKFSIVMRLKIQKIHVPL